LRHAQGPEALHQVIDIHDRSKRDLSLDQREQRFRQRNDLGRIGNVQNEEARALSVLQTKVGGLRLEPLKRFWGEIPPLFGGPGRDKTARSAGSVPELSNTTVGGWQTPCSGDRDLTASPCRRSRFQNSPVRSATVVTATDLAQG